MEGTPRQAWVGKPVAEKRVETVLPGIACAGVGGSEEKRLISHGFISALLFPQTMSQAMWAVSSCISVAFFALSGIAAQLLNALGLDGEWQGTGWSAGA